MSLVEALEWRYATKKYDTSRQLSDEQFDDLFHTVQLAPLVVLPTYSDTKAALHSHTVALRHGLAKETAIKVFEVMPSLVNTEATKDMGGQHGMHPNVVAAMTAKAIEADQYELYVGDTAAQRTAYLANPMEAIENFNKGL